MKPHKQLIQNDPEKGRHGDCYRTCVAVIMDKEPGDVPHIFDGGASTAHALALLRDWLEVQEHGLWRSAYLGELTFEQVIQSLDEWSPGVPAIVTGMSPRGTNHAVVVLNGQVYCDPFTGKAEQEPFSGPAQTLDNQLLWYVEVIARVPWAISAPDAA